MFANCPMSTKYPPCGRLSCLALTDTAPLWSGPQLRHAATCAALVIFPSRHLEESSSASTTSVAVLTRILSTIWLKKIASDRLYEVMLLIDNWRCVKFRLHVLYVCYPWSTDLDGVIPEVVFTIQLHFSCSYLPLIFLSTNQNIQLIHSLLIRIEWTTGNGILMSSSHWPIYNKLYPGLDAVDPWML